MASTVILKPKEPKVSATFRLRRNIRLALKAEAKKQKVPETQLLEAILYHCLLGAPNEPH